MKNINEMGSKPFLHSTAALIGTMVGVGIFAIPLAFAKAGFLVGVGFMIFAGFITGLFTLLFAEVVLRTEGRHQLVGYTNIYLGAGFKRIIFWANAVGIYGALLAYIIIAGGFLHNIFSNFFTFTPDTYSFIFAVMASAMVFFSLRTGAWIEFALTVFFILVMLIIFGVGVGHIDPENLKGFNIEFWFLPYGVMLFAFAGLTSVPLQREILRGYEKLLKPSILTAVSIVGVLYFLFTLTVVGVSGDNTSPDALGGLLEILGPQVTILGSIFGSLAILTSFIMLGLALRDIFRLDYKVRPIASWFLVILPPIIMFWGGMRNFIEIIGMIGSVAIGIESVILVLVLRKARRHGQREPEFHLKIPQWMLYLFIPIFLSGVIYDLFF